MRSLSSLRTGFLCAACLCWCTSVFAQSFEEYKKQSQALFQAYKQQQEASAQAFRDKINKEFSKRLGHPWSLQEPKPATKNPLKEIPPAPIPPVPETRVTKPDASYTSVKVMNDFPVLVKDDKLPPLGMQEPESITHVMFNFMGDYCDLFKGRKRVIPASVKESDISRAWEEMACPDYYLLAATFRHLQNRLALCDWATLSLAEEAANCFCESKTSTESVLLQVWLLSQSGLQVTMAVDENDKLRLLVATDKLLFDYPALFADGQVFYVIDHKPIKEAAVQAFRFPGTRPVKMAFESPFKSQERSIQGSRSMVDQNRIRFYNRYPDYCDEGFPLSSFYYHAMVPLSQSAKNALYPALKKRIEGKSTAQAAEILLKYIQMEYPYREDEKVWRKERYFYAEETLCYDYSDCEDRAILYSWLVRDLLGLKTALVYYPGHVATAVRFMERIPGDATIIDGERYLICDPTFMEASIGMEMTTVDRSKARVIPL